LLENLKRQNVLFDKSVRQLIFQRHGVYALILSWCLSIFIVNVDIVHCLDFYSSFSVLPEVNLLVGTPSEELKNFVGAEFYLLHAIADSKVLPEVIC